MNVPLTHARPHAPSNLQSEPTTQPPQSLLSEASKQSVDSAASTGAGEPSTSKDSGGAGGASAAPSSASTPTGNVMSQLVSQCGCVGWSWASLCARGPSLPTVRSCTLFDGSR